MKKTIGFDLITRREELRIRKRKGRLVARLVQRFGCRRHRSRPTRTGATNARNEAKAYEKEDVEGRKDVPIEKEDTFGAGAGAEKGRKGRTTSEVQGTKMNDIQIPDRFIEVTGTRRKRSFPSFLLE